MYRHSAKVLRTAFVLAASAAVSSPSFGTMGLPSGDEWGNGDFGGLEYGATGTAYVTAFLYVSDLGTTVGPQTQATLTNLTYNYAYGFSGAGNSQFTVTYSIRNDDPAPFSDLRFIVNVQPDGSATYKDIAGRNPAGLWDAATGGVADGYQIVDWSANLKESIASNDGLTNTDACGGTACDVDFALQWNLASLAPGLTWNLTVLLSDDGSTLSSRYLSATSVDTTGTSLTFSGTAAVVPLPPAWLLLMAAVGSLGLAGRRRAGGR